MNMSTDLRNAFIKTIPIMCGYLFLGFAFGISLQQAGFGAGWALLISTIVYAGSLQFVLVPFLASGAPLVSVFLTSLFVNSRHIFYGLSFLERFRRMKQAYPYMVFSLTDETYSVLCAQKDVDALSDRELFFIHLLDQLYWIVGSLGGALLGSVLPFDFTGIDFAMTALFGVIFYEQMEQAANRLPAVVGIGCAIVCLLLFGAENFLLPALVSAAVGLSLLRPWLGRERT